MKSDRRTFLLLAGAAAASPLARSQYVLPPQAPPSEKFPPSPAQAAEIAHRLSDLQGRIAALRKKNVADESLVEVEIFQKAAAWIARFGEYYGKDCPAQIVNLLETGLGRAAELESGKTPWTSATGPVIRAYRSRVDGSVQPYIAHVPAAYDGSRPGRLDVILHGTNRGMVEVQFMSHAQIVSGSTAMPPVDFLQIEVFGRTNNAYRWAGETDVMEAVEAAKRSYRVDENRIALRGFSMGGAGTWHLGLHHPDVWVAIEPGAGFTDTIRYARMPNLPAHELKALHIYDSKDYALNVFQLPTSAYAGEDDAQSAGMANVREELAKSDYTFGRDGLNWTTKDLPMQMLVGPKTGHRWEPESHKRSNVFMDAAAKKGRTDPDHIRFVTYTTRYNRCFWLTVDGLDRHYDKAEINAVRSQADGTVRLTTKNVSSLTLKSSSVKKVDIDGQTFASLSGSDLRFQKQSGAWKTGQDNALRKRHGLQGPIDDAFLESFLCVRSTGRPANDLAGRYAQETLDTFATDFAKWFRGQVRIKDDTAVTPEDIRDHHLILFGDPEGNQVLKRIAGQLPIRWDAHQLSLGGKSFDAANHTVAMIYPNPLEPRRYVVLNSGHSFHALEMAATNATLFPRFGDYAIIGLRQPVGAPVEGEVVTAGYFDEEWKAPRLA
jgi:dienelactone hydrolase